MVGSSPAGAADFSQHCVKNTCLSNNILGIVAGATAEESLKKGVSLKLSKSLR